MIPAPLAARVRRLASDAGFSISRLRELPGDVGNRRYFRLSGSGRRTVIAVVYPPGDDAARARWLRVRQALRSRVRVPEVLADDGAGVQILEDFGEASFSRAWRAADAANRRALARGAARVAAAIGSATDPGANPPFSGEFFFAEMAKSREGFFASFARLPLSREEEGVHDAFARALALEIAAHPQAFLHRDFHSENLFLVGGDIGVLDFQDARSGPDSYDLASLTRERSTLLEFDPAAERAALRLFQGARRPPPGLRRRMLRVRLQRAWKAAGTFAAVCGRTKSVLARRYLAGEVRLVLELLGKSGEEGEFRRILAGRSAKLLGTVKEEAKC